MPSSLSSALQEVGRLKEQIPERPLALFCDFDGTLVELASHPDNIHVPDELPQLIAKCHERFDFHIITGRSLSDLSKHIDLAGLNASGIHGAEHTAADKNDSDDELNRLKGRIAQLNDVLQKQFGMVDGLLIEDKGIALAIHYRQCMDHQKTIHDFVIPLVNDVKDMECLAGKCLIEVRPKSVNKGNAVKYWLNTANIHKNFSIFIGDDYTDEFGFDMCNQLNGMSILVGDRKDTSAGYALKNVSEVCLFLNQLTAL